MKARFVALITILFVAPTLAAPSDCLEAAKEKKLAGTAQGSLVGKCVRERCEAAAAERKLGGAARTSFTTKCLTDGLLDFCSGQAESKKLPGAARNSFMNNCQTG